MRIATVLKIAGIGLVAASVGAVAVLMSIDVNQYKDDITAKVQEITGRTLKIDGDLSMSLGLQPAVVVNGVHFANAPWSTDPEMITVERFEAQVDLISALTGTIDVQRLVIVKPTIILETKDGKANWQLEGLEASAKDEAASGSATSGDGAADPAAAQALTLPNLRAVDLQDVRLIYRDGDQGTEHVVTLDHLTAQADALEDPLTVAVAGAYGPTAFDLEGNVGALSLLSQPSVSYPVTLGGTVAGLDLGVDGVVKDPLNAAAVDMAITVDAQSLDGLKAFIGEVPQTPPLSVKARVTGAGTSWAAQGLSLTAGRSTLTGDVAIALDGKRPDVTLALQAALIDLQELLPQAAAEAEQASQNGLGSGAESQQTAGGKVLPTDALPLDGLRAADVKADIGISKIILPNGIAFDGLGIKATLDGGKLRLNPASARLGGGAVQLTGVANGASGKSLAIDLTLKADDVVLGTLFEQIKRPDLVTGSPTDAVITLEGNGASVSALAGSLDGHILVTIGAGKIHNDLIDWAGADLINQLSEQLDPFADKSPYTDLACGVLNIGAANGKLTWDQEVAFQTTKMNVVSSGMTNMGPETLDIAVRPYAREGVGISAGKLAEMVRLQGTYARPAIGVDAEGVVRNVGSIVGAVATGGASLLVEGLYEQAAYEPEPCKVALGQKERASSSSSGGSSSGSVVDQAKDTVEGVGKAIGDGIGGLFGR